jgi:hypothetical protein
LETLDLGYLVNQEVPMDENSLPKLNMPVGIGSGLPNKLIFYHVSKDDIFAPKQLVFISNVLIIDQCLKK